MENEESNLSGSESVSGAATIRFSPEEERECFVALRGQLIKLLYMIESEMKGECTIDLWFYGFMLNLASSNALCHNKLTQVIVKIHGLYDGSHYKQMSHAQIKRQIMESKGILDHLIGDKRR